MEDNENIVRYIHEEWGEETIYRSITWPWAKKRQEAPIYFETGNYQQGQRGEKIAEISRIKQPKKPDTNLISKEVNIKAGHFWVKDLPDWDAKNEALFEINPASVLSGIGIPSPFKLRIDVNDDSFCRDVQHAKLAVRLPIMGDGIEFNIRLTEEDKINKDKFNAIKSFVDSSETQKLTSGLVKATGLPIDPKQAVKFIFQAVNLFDVLNDDDRVWLEKPWLDFAPGSSSPLYEGSYAIVGRDKDYDPPETLYSANGYLYLDTNLTAEYKETSWFTWWIYGVNVRENELGLEILKE